MHLDVGTIAALVTVLGGAFAGGASATHWLTKRRRDDEAKQEEHLRTEADRENWQRNVDGYLFGTPASKFRAGSEGVDKQVQKTAETVNELGQMLTRLREQFDEHVNHPPVHVVGEA